MFTNYEKKSPAHGRFGSQAALHRYSSPMAASGTNPVVRRTDFQVWTVNVCFHQKQSFRSLILVGFEGQLTAEAVSKETSGGQFDALTKNCRIF
jgi:hypothetical protein